MRKLTLLVLLLSTVGLASAFSADLSTIQASLDQLYTTVRLQYVAILLQLGILLFFCCRIK